MREPDLARERWETGVFLMRKFDTEAIRIVIPVVGEADDDDLKSFVAAINLGMRRHFAGKVDHLRSTIFGLNMSRIVEADLRREVAAERLRRQADRAGDREGDGTWSRTGET